jgi:hypothetical protein
MDSNEIEFTDNKVQNLLEKRVIRVVKVKARRVSVLKVTLKKNLKKYLLIINMYWIGRYLRVSKFKFEDLESRD